VTTSSHHHLSADSPPEIEQVALPAPGLRRVASINTTGCVMMPALLPLSTGASGARLHGAGLRIILSVRQHSASVLPKRRARSFSAIWSGEEGGLGVKRATFWRHEASRVSIKKRVIAKVQPSG